MYPDIVVDAKVFLSAFTRSAVAAVALVCFPQMSHGGQASAQPPAATRPSQLKVFLDCQGCFADFLRAEVTFVDYVRDRVEADVHVLITSVETGGGGREYTAAFTGLQTHTGTDRTIRTVTTRNDPEDIVRRQLANALRVGLLNYMVATSVPANLAVSVKLGAAERDAAPTKDRWNHWVFSVRGSASFSGEESSRERQLGGSVSADRITPNWKITLGSEFDHETEEFDLDEDDPVKVERRERDFNFLAVKALGEHWSVGGLAEIESSTFDNVKLSVAAAPAIEFNVFPYSAYTRRQLRALYVVGVKSFRYNELTLFQKTKETLPVHELSLTFEQRERWGTLEARGQWSQYLHQLDKSRFEIEADVSVRVARGLSIGAELNASRIRDQISLPARGASPEEILLRLRQLRSGYEYNFGVSLTYSFGSIFSSIVNPRFGQ
jgi:hypothetical protein